MTTLREKIASENGISDLTQFCEKIRNQVKNDYNNWANPLEDYFIYYGISFSDPMDAMGERPEISVLVLELSQDEFELLEQDKKMLEGLNDNHERLFSESDDIEEAFQTIKSLAEKEKTMLTHRIISMYNLCNYFANIVERGNSTDEMEIFKRISNQSYLIIETCGDESKNFILNGGTPEEWTTLRDIVFELYLRDNE